MSQHDQYSSQFLTIPIRQVSTRFFLAVAMTTCAALPVPAQDKSADEIPGRRIYVPVEDLDVVLGRDKQGVLLPRGEFAELYAAAKKNSQDAAQPPQGVILSSAGYRARIDGDQLLISAKIDVTQFEPGWHAAVTFRWAVD